MRFADIPVLLRELLMPREVTRQAEPTAAMDAADQVAAYTLSAAASGALSGAYCWQAARIAQAIAGRTRVLDLGCASAVQLALTASLNPQAAFTGLDLAAGMLEQARTTIRQHGLANVELRQGDMTRLPFAEDSFDAVISTMACHHLPDAAALRATLAEVARVLVPGGALYLADLQRPRRASTVTYLAHRGNEQAPPLFIEDYAHSLRAAFTGGEWRQAAAGLLPTASLSTMRPLPVLGALATRLSPLPAAARPPLRRLYAGLGREGRQTLADIRLGFRLSGPDPFRSLDEAHATAEETHPRPA